jgi:hypothetical protein
MREVFRMNDTLQVFKLGTTTNEKIMDDRNEKLVQTYTFSRKQYELVSSGLNDGMKTFFSVADTNCLDCVFNSFGACYTHKFNQYIGFISMLKSIARKYPTWESIPTEYSLLTLIVMSTNRYIRFGTYGEPSLHPQDLIKAMVNVSKSYTGYTHQWKKNDLGDYFMASTHTKDEALIAATAGYRSFIVSDDVQEAVNCPASKEAGYKTSCNKCNLCSGVLGTKSKKDIFILTH